MNAEKLNKLEHGQIIEDRIYYKVCKPIHFFMKYSGFAISEDILNILKGMNIKLIKICYKGKKGDVIYYATLRQYLESKNVYYFREIDKQKVLSIRDMFKE